MDIEPQFIWKVQKDGGPPAHRTLTTFLMDDSNARKGSWQTLAAGIIMLPAVLIYLFFQKYILAGVAAGAVKE